MQEQIVAQQLAATRTKKAQQDDSSFTIYG